MWPSVIIHWRCLNATRWNRTFVQTCRIFCVNHATPIALSQAKQTPCPAHTIVPAPHERKQLHKSKNNSWKRNDSNHKTIYMKAKWFQPQNNLHESEMVPTTKQFTWKRNDSNHKTIFMKAKWFQPQNNLHESEMVPTTKILLWRKSDGLPHKAFIVARSQLADNQMLHAQKHTWETTFQWKGKEDNGVLDIPQVKYRKEVDTVPKSQCDPVHGLRCPTSHTTAWNKWAFLSNDNFVISKNLSGNISRCLCNEDCRDIFVPLVSTVLALLGQILSNSGLRILDIKTWNKNACRILFIKIKLSP